MKVFWICIISAETGVLRGAQGMLASLTARAAGSKSIRNIGSNNVVCKGGVPMPTAGEVGNAPFPVPLQRHGRRHRHGQFLVHPRDPRFDGDGIAGPTGSCSAAKPSGDG